MKFKYRAAILIILIIIFFTVSPILILWTLGYRYNPKKITIEKTGLLFVKTEPKGADIYLNGKKRKQRTPAKIKYLLPDIYNLRIEKKGFIPYKKKITIKSGFTTFVDNILLFKQNLPILMTSEEMDEKALYAAQHKEPMSSISDIDTTFLPQNYKHYILDTINSHFIFKNPSNTKLLIFDANKQIIFDDYGKEVVFNENNNDEFIVYGEFEINLYNIAEKKKDFISRSSKEIKNVFFLEDNYILYALENGVYVTEKQAKNSERATMHLAAFSKIQSVILDDKQENLYILGEINDKSGIYKLNFR